MTQRIGPVLVIAPEPPRECSECHALAECRPYGRNGADLCFACAALPHNAAVVRANMRARLEGVEPAPPKRRRKRAF